MFGRKKKLSTIEKLEISDGDVLMVFSDFSDQMICNLLARHLSQRLARQGREDVTVIVLPRGNRAAVLHRG